MSDILNKTQKENISTNTTPNIKNLQQTIISGLIKYLEKPRKLELEQYDYKADHQWSQEKTNSDIGIFPTFTFKNL